MLRLSIPERAACYLAKMPPAVSGEGGHAATFRAAHAIVNGFGLDEAVAIALLLAHYNPRCLPPWLEAELRHKVRDALANPGAKGRGYLLNEGEILPHAVSVLPHKPKWPAPDLALIREIVRGGPTAAELTLRSPGPLDDEDAGHNAAPIVQAMFADAHTPDPFLCIGKSSREFATRPLSAWLASGRLSEFSFIVPAHMTARTGNTKAGKVSEHTLDNTGPRRFLVVEFDFAEANKATGEPTMYAPLIAHWRGEGREATDACAALLWHLDGYAPLALVVHSGGKSLHGWFPIVGCQPKDVERFMRHAAHIGADPTLFRNRSQFVRLPGGTREGGCRQSVFCFAPGALVQGAANTGKGNPYE